MIEEIANDIYATYEFEAESSTIVNADLASQRITFDTGLFFEVWNKIHPLNLYQIIKSLSFRGYSTLSNKRAGWNKMCRLENSAKIGNFKNLKLNWMGLKYF